MIAVFAREDIKFRGLKFLPKEQFCIIQDSEDLIGVKFDAVVIIQHNFNSMKKSKLQAFEMLKFQQPELFK